MVMSPEGWDKTAAALEERRARSAGLELELMRQVLFLNSFIRYLAIAAAVFGGVGLVALVVFGFIQEPFDGQSVSFAIASTALGLSAAIGGMNLYAQRLAAMRELLKYWERNARRADSATS